MTTQGISLVTSKASEKMTVRNARKSDSTFDSLMTDRASKADVSQQRDSKPDKALDSESAEKPDQALPLKKDHRQQLNIPIPRIAGCRQTENSS